MNKNFLTIIISSALFCIIMAGIFANALDNSRTRKDICRTAQRNLEQYKDIKVESIQIIDFNPDKTTFLKAEVTYKDCSGVIELRATYVGNRIKIIGADSELSYFKMSCDVLGRQF